MRKRGFGLDPFSESTETDVFVSGQTSRALGERKEEFFRVQESGLNPSVPGRRSKGNDVEEDAGFRGRTGEVDWWCLDGIELE